MLVLKLEEGVDTALDLRVQPELVGVRASGQVAVDHNLVSVVMQAELVEIPEVVVGLVEEVEPVESVDPAHLHLDVERRAVDGFVLAGVVPHLVDGYAIRVGHDVPISKVAVDTGNLGSWKLEHLEARFGYLYVGLGNHSRSRQQHR